MRLIELFSGIGSQAKALKNLGIEYSVEAISEWEIGAIIAYDLIHNGPQDLSSYRHHTKQSLVDALSGYGLSADGKESMSERALNGLNVSQLKSILCAIERTNNLVDITKVKAESLPETDILTYSFPCQDLSISGHWHGNSGGIDRQANNRSTLLWQVERILSEFDSIDKSLPKFLLMENVSNILSNKHRPNFIEFQKILERLGYFNQVYTLDARDFGVPQSRKRTYMLSVLIEREEDRSLVEKYFYDNNLENVSNADYSLEGVLKLDYSNEVYRSEAIQSTPKLTPSRIKIFEENPILAKGMNIEMTYARTVTTKQDRNPNSGLVAYTDEILDEKNPRYRNLTARECFLLMGFEEQDFDRIVDTDLSEGKKQILTQTKLIKLAGNSIVVDVLEAIFKQVVEIDQLIRENCSVSEEH